MAITRWMGRELTPEGEHLVEAMVKAKLPNDQIDALLGPTAFVIPPPQPKINYQVQPAVREWKNEPPIMTYNDRHNTLSPLGAIYLRLNMPEGARPAGIQHISAHVVQPVEPHSFQTRPVEKAFVFIVNDKHEAVTIEDPTPAMFPSDGLILAIKMIMESSELKPNEMQTTTGVQQAQVGMSGALQQQMGKLRRQILDQEMRMLGQAIHPPVKVQP